MEKIDIRKIENKLPQKFCENMKNLLGDEYNIYLKSFGAKPNSALRKNSLKAWTGYNYEELNLEKVPWVQNGYYFQNEDAGKSIYHDAGLYYIQDASAMAVVELMDIAPHEKVLDLCAAPGGKSTQIADKLQNTGLLVANEIVPSRAKILSYNIERMGITNTIVLNESVEKIANILPNYFDKVLVDAPCSGEGMFRKNESAIDEWKNTDIYSCAIRQLGILEEAAKCVKSGGTLVYSTCTFNLEENEKVIEKFLTKHADFYIYSPPFSRMFSSGFNLEKFGEKTHIDTTKCIRLFPHKLNCEGHFICVMKRKEIEQIEYKNIKPNISNKNKEIVKKWSKENNIPILFDNMYEVGDNIYILPEFNFNLKNNKFLRAGMHVGQIIKDRFEPSHSLAIAQTHPQKIVNTIDPIELKRYLHGEVLSVENKQNGWYIICYENIPIGWGKNSNGQLKNYYPKGLRK